MMTPSSSNVIALASLGATVVSAVLEAEGDDVAAHLLEQLVKRFGAAWAREKIDAWDVAEAALDAREAAHFSNKGKEP